MESYDEQSEEQSVPWWLIWFVLLCHECHEYEERLHGNRALQCLSKTEIKFVYYCIIESMSTS